MLIDWLIVQALRLNLLTAVLLGASAWMLGYQAWLGFNTIHTDAIVVAFDERLAPGVEPLGRPRVRLRLVVDGRGVDCADTSVMWRWTHYAADQIVPVLFYPSQPRPECTIDTFARRWLLGLVLLVCGFAMLTVMGNVWSRRYGSPELR